MCPGWLDKENNELQKLAAGGLKRLELRPNMKQLSYLRGERVESHYRAVEE